MPTSLHLSLPEYDRMVRCGAFVAIDRKVELIRGELTEMNPAGPLHDDLIVYLTNWSFRNIDPASTLVTSQTGLDLPDLASRPEPDLMWLRAVRYRDHHPTATDVQLAIEVADSSLETDREVKRKLYAEAKITEYWVVDARARHVHVHRDPEAGEYRQREKATTGQQISPLYRPTAILTLDVLFEGEALSQEG